jgi:hypothetical protein
MLCADLARTAQGTFSGTLAQLASFTSTAYGAISSATATLTKPELATTVSFSGAGFTNGVYDAAVYVDTCAAGATTAFNGGDGATADAVNEIGSPISVTCTTGVCTGTAWNDFGLPATGVGSIVVKDAVADTGTAAKENMLCGDAVYDAASSSYSASLTYLATYTALVTAGTSTGYGEISGGYSTSAKGGKSKGKKRSRRDPGHSAQFSASFGTAATSTGKSGKSKGGKSGTSAKGAKVASVHVAKASKSKGSKTPKVGKMSAAEGVNLAGNNGHANNSASMFAGGFAAAMVLGVGMYMHQKKRIWGSGYGLIDSEAAPLADYGATNTYSM